MTLENANINPANIEEELEEELFEDYEADFEEEFAELAFDATTQATVRYGTEEIVVEADGSATISEIFTANNEALGFRDLSRLNFRVHAQYVSGDYRPVPGEVIVASANGDTKGN